MSHNPLRLAMHLWDDETNGGCLDEHWIPADWSNLTDFVWEDLLEGHPYPTNLADLARDLTKSLRSTATALLAPPADAPPFAPGPPGL